MNTTDWRPEFQMTAREKLMLLFMFTRDPISSAFVRFQFTQIKGLIKTGIAGSLEPTLPEILLSNTINFILRSFSQLRPANININQEVKIWWCNYNVNLITNILHTILYQQQFIICSTQTTATGFTLKLYKISWVLKIALIRMLLHLEGSDSSCKL